VVHAVGGVGEIRRGCEPSSEHGDRWKLVDERSQHPVHRLPTELSFETRQGVGPHVRRLLPTVPRYQQMEHLIDEPEGVDLACTHRPLRELEEIAALVHAVCKDPGGVKIGKDHVTGDRKQGLVETINFARPPRDMKLARRAIMETGGSNSHLRIRAHVTCELGIRN